MTTTPTPNITIITTSINTNHNSYKEWDEPRRLEWLTAELATKRPLVPADMPMSDEVRRAGGHEGSAACWGR